MNLKEIKLKLFEKLKPSGWDRVFKSFIFSSDFDKIITDLWNLSKIDKRFTPPIKDIFKAFEECPYNELKVIIINSEPYVQLGVADGIAFSSSKTNNLPTALQYMFKQLNGTQWESLDPDLKRWSNQGILMLNTALTVQIGKKNTHYEIWKPFTAYLLDWLNNFNTGLVYVYVGKKVENWSEVTNDNNYKLFVKHPTSAAYNGGEWDCDRIFHKISTLTQEINGEFIKW